MTQKKVQNRDIHVQCSGRGPQRPRIHSRKAEEPVEPVPIAGKPAKGLQSQNFRHFRVHHQGIVKGALRDTP